MAIGNQATQASINAQAGQLVIGTRNNIMDIIQFNSWLQSVGQDGLVSTYGFTAEDATELLNVFVNMNAVAELCQGMPYTGPELPFNFVGQTVPLWGGA